MTWIDAQHEIDELLDAHLAQAAAFLIVQGDGDDDDFTDAPPLHKYAPKVAFQVFMGGHLITHSSNAGTVAMSQHASGFATVQSATGELWRVFTTSNPPREVQVFVGEQIESRQSILWAVMRSTMLPLMFVLPLLGLAVWWSVRTGLAPLHALGLQLSRRPPQAMEAVPLQGLPSELRPMVQELNELFERIGRMVDTERRFTADAAHELRTPIAAIRAQAQVALGAGDDAEERNHALRSTLQGCDRITRLVEQLLTLARLEAQQADMQQAVDLGAVCRQIIGDLVPAALGRQQTIELDAEGICSVSANEVLVGVLVRNLVDNALRYSPVGATVVASVQCSASGVELYVQDSGPGMSDDDMLRLGERFYRVLGNDQPGSGLGWSIVRRLTHVFGASVAVQRSQALGGLSVCIRWPALRS
jgi:two-component system sensor histidine kinase QseC